MPQHRSATRAPAGYRAALWAAVISDEACSSPARVNSIASARAKFSRAAIRSACWVSASATRPGG